MRTIVIPNRNKLRNNKKDQKETNKQRDALFIRLILSAGLPKPEPEHKFAQQTLKRLWRFDFAFLDAKLAIEIEGGAFLCSDYFDKRTGKIVRRSGGRHNTATGALNDMIKYNAAIELGWAVLRYPPQNLNTTQTIDQIKRIYEQRIRK